MDIRDVMASSQQPAFALTAGTMRSVTGTHMMMMTKIIYSRWHIREPKEMVGLAQGRALGSHCITLVNIIQIGSTHYLIHLSYLK